MEASGLGFDPWHLQAAGAQAKAHMARLEAEAAGVAGRPFNLASPQQLAEVLYTTLKVGSRVCEGAARSGGSAEPSRQQG